MNCPKQFFYSYLTKVRPMDSVDEDGDRSAFGTLVHDVLNEFLAPYINRQTDLASLDATPLLHMFDEQLRTNETFSKLPLDTRMALSKTGRQRLTAFHESQEPCKLIGLEKELDATANVDGVVVPIKGRVDRIEERESGIFIFDYKTGSSGNAPKQEFWDDMDMWERIEDFDGETDDPLFLKELAADVRSVQLPLYMHLYSERNSCTPYEAGLIKLAENGKNVLLFGKKWSEDQRKDAVDVMTPKLIKALIRHMIHAPKFTAQPSTLCQWCDFKGPCGQ